MNKFEYKLIVDISGEKLEKRVNEYLAGEWKLYGDPILTMTTGPRFAQAIIREYELAGAWG